MPKLFVAVVAGRRVYACVLFEYVAPEYERALDEACKQHGVLRFRRHGSAISPVL
jgi:hypothetical protein